MVLSLDRMKDGNTISSTVVHSPKVKKGLELGPVYREVGDPR